MKKVLDGILYIILVILAVILAVVIFKNYNANVKLNEEVVEETPVVTPEIIFPSESDSYIPEAGENTYTIDLAVAGDVVCHSGLNEQAYDAETETYNYDSLFVDSAAILSAADFAVASLETTFPETETYSGYPLFLSPTSLADSLKSAGIDLLSTATNHALDSGVDGLSRTLDVLDEKGIDYVGTYRSEEERDATSGVKVVEVEGINIAFLSYAYGTDGIDYGDADYSINIYNSDYQNGSGDIRYDLISADMASAKEQGADIIAVFMHWGDEYSQSANDEQIELSDFLFKEGADIILGGHAHVLEPMEMREFEDNDGNKKTGFIIYNLGNFVSCQNDMYTNLTAILNIEISHDPDIDETWVSGVGYTPMFMVDLEDYDISSIDAGWHYGLWDLHNAIDGYDESDEESIINEQLYNAMKTGLEDIHNILGKDYDLYYSQDDSVEE